MTERERAPGRDGIDGRVVVGQVIGGHFAAAVVRVEDDVQIIDLVLPRGPEGSQGAPGRDASIEDIRRVIVEVLSSDEMRSAFLGECGSQGATGPVGTPGRDGRDRINGKDGVSNIPGPRGEVGPQGIPGPVGPVGPPGPTGAQGLRGPIGKPGDISAAVAQAKVEARHVAQEALAEIVARLARLEAKVDAGSKQQ